MLIVATAAWVAYHTRDRHPGYAIDLCLMPTSLARTDVAAAAPPLRVGFGRERITPDLSRTTWLAGFASGRRATAIHDDLWAVAIVIDDGEHRVGLVALDSIGVFHDDVIEIREAVAAQASLDYVVVASTHNHSTPDLMGLWGRRTGLRGVDDVYRRRVIASAAKAVVSAASATAAVRMSLLEIPLPTDGLIADSRPPQVFDNTLRMMHFTSIADGSTVGSVVNWADHPETPWSSNTEVTADFPGYLRDALEHGVPMGAGRAGGAGQAGGAGRDDSGSAGAWQGLGGIHLYVNGAIGGLMTTNPETTVVDPFSGEAYAAPSHDKARAVGRRLADAIFRALDVQKTADSGAATATSASATSEPPATTFPEVAPRLSVMARTIQLPVRNPLFKLALSVGTVDRGQPRVNQLRTEIGLIQLGDASLALLPGEVYPEIANGGITRLEGADFPIEPVEVPSLRELMPGRVKFLVGLANDEIGYIIPKSEWDNEAPWLNGAPRRLYGEQISLGPETAPLLHDAFRQLTHR